MKKSSIKKIVVTGPESSGKTTLAQLISEHLVVEMVPEFARKYLENKNAVYDESDLLKIAEGQIESEEATLENAERLIICDTDLLTIKIWSEYKYGHCDDFILHNVQNRHYDLYLLCSPEIPWEPDPLREHPEHRFQLYEIYKRTLIFYEKNYIEIKGTPNQRLDQALTNISSHSF